MNMQQTITTDRSYGLMLFGLPFFSVGALFLFISIIPTFYDYVRMQSWPTTQGELTHAELSAERSDGSTNYRAIARYTYTVKDKKYQSERVAINSGSDNLEFQRRLGSTLEYRYKQHSPVTVYYNQSSPDDAVLNRDLRLKLLAFKSIFIVLFGGIGAGIIYWGWRGKRSIVTPDATTKPWLTRPEWRNGDIRSGAKTTVIAVWVLAVIWNTLSLPGVFQFMDVWEKKGPIALGILLFPLVGIGGIYFAIKLTREWKRYGSSLLTLDPYPGAINGDVGGEVHINAPYHSDMVSKVTLSNIYSYKTGSGKNTSRHEEVKWQDDGYARVHADYPGTKLEFRFEVPNDLEESEEVDTRYHFWRLNVQLETDGIDMDRNFNIPVYNTGAQSTRTTINSSSEHPAGIAKVTAETLLPLSRQGGYKVITYPMMKKPGRSAGLTIFGSIFMGTGMFINQGDNTGLASSVLPIIFILIGAGVLLAAIYSMVNSLRIIMDGREVASVRSLLGIPVHQNKFLYDNVLAIESKRGMQTNIGNKHAIEYSVLANLQGKKIILAKHLDSASKRDLVVAYFEQELMKKTGT